MVVMRRCNALEEFVFVSLHKEKKFLEPRQLIPPGNLTADTQMPTSHLARKSVETPFSIQRNLFLFVNPMGVGLRFNAESLRGIVGAWTAVGMKSLALEVLIWKFALISVN